MTHVPAADEGRLPAIAVYVIYLVGVFSANLLSPIGVIVAYAVRGGADPWVRTHLDRQIKLFWTVIFWTVGLILLAVVLTPILVGVIIWFLLVPAGLILTIWFAVKSALGLMRLLDNRPA
ncbi:MAG TPA: hypothetical protein VD929_05430 [Caulobacteraceae bacterium]|nr:hypothetical protein [Caulobacteraceae bacterium]